MLRFVQFLSEGGNIKVGDAQASPFPVTAKNRSSIQHDIHSALSHIHDSFKDATGHDLLGSNKKALETRSAFAGSTKHLMSNDISHKEFAQHKPKVGDVDVQIPSEHKEALAKHLSAGKNFGNYTVAGIKKHGNEVSAVMKHKNGQIHQIDFEGVEYHNNEPTKGEQFLHSSNWEDTKLGIKGAHHKILLNAAGGAKHKFSISHGVRSRTDENDKGSKEPEQIAKTIFGGKADASKIHSFSGVTELIKHHIPKAEHQAIYDKFKSGSVRHDSSAALAHLRQHLDVKDTVNEAVKKEVEHHTSVIPLVGFSPISHMGHATDLGGTLKSLPGEKHIGISSKADLFSPKERADVLRRQWGKKSLNTHIVKSAGETVANAFHSLPQQGKKHLHLLVGSDRKDFAEGLKKSLEGGKIKEMGGHKFDKISIHTPEDTGRSHGMSGTAMRTAARDSDIETFHKHLGPDFSRKEATNIMKRVKTGIDTGMLKVKR